jgi:hypothetical protein
MNSKIWPNQTALSDFLFQKKNERARAVGLAFQAQQRLAFALFFIIFFKKLMIFFFMVFFSIFFKFVFKLPPILFFILFEEPFLNDEYFLVILLNLKSFSNPSIYFFNLLYR